MLIYPDEQLDALGDRNRREILVLLRGRPLAVTDIARFFTVSRPAISQHLKILKDAGLVIGRADGNRRVYAINPRGFAALRDYADLFSSVRSQAETEPAEDTSWRNW